MIADSIWEVVIYHLHPLKDGKFSGIVIASIHDTDGFRPSLLRGSDSRPEHSFAASASIAAQIFSVPPWVDGFTITNQNG